MCGKRSGEFLGPSMQSGVAPWVRDWALGSAPFLSHWTGEFSRHCKNKLQILDLHTRLGTDHGRLSLSPSSSGHTSVMHWGRWFHARRCCMASGYNSRPSRLTRRRRRQTRKPAGRPRCRVPFFLCYWQDVTKSKILSLNIVDIHKLLD